MSTKTGEFVAQEDQAARLRTTWRRTRVRQRASESCRGRRSRRSGLVSASYCEPPVSSSVLGARFGVKPFVSAWMAAPDFPWPTGWVDRCRGLAAQAAAHPDRRDRPTALSRRMGPGRALGHHAGDPLLPWRGLSHLWTQHPPRVGVVPVPVGRRPGAQRRLSDAAALPDQQCGRRCAGRLSVAVRDRLWCRRHRGGGRFRRWLPGLHDRPVDSRAPACRNLLGWWRFRP